MTYQDLVNKNPTKDMRIVAMLSTVKGFIIATPHQIYTLENNNVKPLEMEEVK